MYDDAAFAAVHESAVGTSRHFAAVPYFAPIGGMADIAYLDEPTTIGPKGSGRFLLRQREHLPDPIAERIFFRRMSVDRDRLETAGPRPKLRD